MRPGIRRGKLEGQELQDLEARLSAALAPVDPGAEYVRDLRLRLEQAVGETHDIPTRSPGQLKGTFVAAAGLAAGGVLLVMGVKAVLALLSALGVWQQVKTQPANSSPASLTPIT